MKILSTISKICPLTRRTPYILQVNSADVLLTRFQSFKPYLIYCVIYLNDYSFKCDILERLLHTVYYITRGYVTHSSTSHVVMWHSSVHHTWLCDNTVQYIPSHTLLTYTADNHFTVEQIDRVWRNVWQENAALRQMFFLLKHQMKTTKIIKKLHYRNTVQMTEWFLITSSTSINTDITVNISS